MSTSAHTWAQMHEHTCEHIHTHEHTHEHIRICEHTRIREHTHTHVSTHVSREQLCQHRPCFSGTKSPDKEALRRVHSRARWVCQGSPPHHTPSPRQRPEPGTQSPRQPNNFRHRTTFPPESRPSSWAGDCPPPGHSANSESTAWKSRDPGGPTGAPSWRGSPGVLLEGELSLLFLLPGLTGAPDGTPPVTRAPRALCGMQPGVLTPAGLH